MSDYEQIAILISVCAIAVSFLALGWNIYRDIILKPRLKVKLQISFIKQGEYESPDKISIHAINFGPNKIICSNIVAKVAPLWRRILRVVKHAIIMYDYTDEYSEKLPCELDVGNTCTLFLPFVDDCFLAEDFTHLGIIDTFGRTHWASRKDIAKAKKKFEETFS